MIIDGHSHVILPTEKHIDLMDNVGVDKTILFYTKNSPDFIRFTKTDAPIE